MLDSGIKLHVLPPVIGRLTALTSLDLSDNDIRILPVEVSLNILTRARRPFFAGEGFVLVCERVTSN